MWNLFTAMARRAVSFAQEEASGCGESYLSREHLLLGLLRDSGNTACLILQHLGVAPERVVAEVRPRLTIGDQEVVREMQLTPAAKRAIDCAFEESQRTKADYMSSGHLLLGLIRASSETGGLLARWLPVTNDVVAGAFQELRITLGDARKAMRHVEQAEEGR